ncbi:Olee1-like protein [Senna tora]|uniref:Olee1-like protein n=1 Tax=Senna tora TaxID=362788 RepID=A0A834VZW4_9FABA|nr:Olee1-like protein [Senna tora]
MGQSGNENNKKALLEERISIKIEPKLTQNGLALSKRHLPEEPNGVSRADRRDDAVVHGDADSGGLVHESARVDVGTFWIAALDERHLANFLLVVSVHFQLVVTGCVGHCLFGEFKGYIIQTRRKKANLLEERIPIKIEPKLTQNGLAISKRHLPEESDGVSGADRRDDAVVLGDADSGGLVHESARVDVRAFWIAALDERHLAHFLFVVSVHFQLVVTGCVGRCLFAECQCPIILPLAIHTDGGSCQVVADFGEELGPARVAVDRALDEESVVAIGHVEGDEADGQGKEDGRFDHY